MANELILQQKNEGFLEGLQGDQARKIRSFAPAVASTKEGQASQPAPCR
jgi:hypothetical protein